MHKIDETKTYSTVASFRCQYLITVLYFVLVGSTYMHVLR